MSPWLLGVFVFSELMFQLKDLRQALSMKSIPTSTPKSWSSQEGSFTNYNDYDTSSTGIVIMTLHYIHVTTSDNDHNPERVRMMMLKITNISSIIVTLQKNILSLSLIGII